MQEISGLGRRFQIGSLYSCLNDCVLNDNLRSPQDEDVVKQIDSKNIVILPPHATFSEKAAALGLSESERISILAGLVPPTGSIRYCTDYRNDSSKATTVIKFSHRSETRTRDFRALCSQLTSLPKNATHIVTGIELGFDAFFVFEVNVEEGVTRKNTQSRLEIFLSGLIGDFGPEENLDSEFGSKISCQFFGDSSSETASMSLEDAMDAIKTLKNNSSPRGFPKVVYLHPIRDIKIVQIPEGKVDQLDTLVFAYKSVAKDIEKVLNPATPDETAGDLNMLKHLAQTVTRTLSEDLNWLIPKIRNGKNSWDDFDQLIPKYIDGGISPEDFRQCFKETCQLAEAINKLMKSAEGKNLKHVPISELDDDKIGPCSKKRIIFAINLSALSSKILPNLKNRILFKSDSGDQAAPAVDLDELERGFGIFLAYSEINHQSAEFLLTEEHDSSEENRLFRIFGMDDGAKCFIKLPYGLRAPALTNEKGIDFIDVIITPAISGKAYVSEYLLTCAEIVSGQITQMRYKVLDEPIRIKNLKPAQRYIFKVESCSFAGLSPPSEWSSEAITDAEERLALKILATSVKVKDTAVSLDIFSPKLKEKYNNDSVRKYHIGDPKNHFTDTTILVVGATGTGKTTFLNSMVNFLYDVRQEDNFRLKIVTQDEERGLDSSSKTKAVSAYCFNNTRLPYRLVVVDTPGFGDTEGIAADRRTTGLIKALFENKGSNGIDQLNAVCIVVKASDSRLTAQQRHNFNSVLQLFGKNVAKNIFIIATFCDASDPPVKACLKDAEIQFTDFFKFNNSAFFENYNIKSSDEKAFQSFYWKAGQQSFETLFAALKKTFPVSLTLYVEVLQKRHEIETLVQALHQMVHHGVSHLEMMRQEAFVMERFEAQIQANQSFTYTVKETRVAQRDISGEGIHTTTCLKCNYTCHRDCSRADNDDKAECMVMSETGKCTVCPKKCHWSIHKNVPYVCEIVEEEVTKTDEDLRQKYTKAQNDKLSKEQLLANLGQQFGNQQMDIMVSLDAIRANIHKLQVLSSTFLTIPFVGCICANKIKVLKSTFREPFDRLYIG